MWDAHSDLVRGGVGRVTQRKWSKPSMKSSSHCSDGSASVRVGGVGAPRTAMNDGIRAPVESCACMIFMIILVRYISVCGPPGGASGMCAGCRMYSVCRDATYHMGGTVRLRQHLLVHGGLLQLGRVLAGHVHRQRAGLAHDHAKIRHAVLCTSVSPQSSEVSHHSQSAEHWGRQQHRAGKLAVPRTARRIRHRPPPRSAGTPPSSRPAPHGIN